MLHPVFTELNKRFLKFSLNEEEKYIEQMYSSLLPNSRQYQIIKTTPFEWGTTFGSLQRHMAM